MKKFFQQLFMSSFSISIYRCAESWLSSLCGKPSTVTQTTTRWRISGPSLHWLGIAHTCRLFVWSYWVIVFSAYSFLLDAIFICCFFHFFFQDMHANYSWFYYNEITFASVLPVLIPDKRRVKRRVASWKGIRTSKILLFVFAWILI